MHNLKLKYQMDSILELVRTLIKDLLGKGSGLFFVGVNIEAKFLTDGSFLGKSSITTLFAFGVRTLKIKMLVTEIEVLKCLSIIFSLIAEVI